jgi:hypothetical protein
MGKQARRLFPTFRRQLDFTVSHVVTTFLQNRHDIDRAASARRHQHHLHWAWRFISGVAVHQNLVT